QLELRLVLGHARTLPGRVSPCNASGRGRSVGSERGVVRARIRGRARSMTVEFGEQIARARQGTGLSEQAFAHFVGDPDAAQEELSELGKVIAVADEAAGQARRRALDALERAEAELEGLAERERALVAREEAF